MAVVWNNNISNNSNTILSQMEQLHQDTIYYNEMPLDHSFQPLSLTIATLFQESFFSPLLRLDLLDQLHVDDFVDSIAPEDIYDSFRETIIQLKLSRSLLKVCHQHLTQQIDSDTACYNLIHETSAVINQNSKAPLRRSRNAGTGPTPPSYPPPPRRSSKPVPPSYPPPPLSQVGPVMTVPPPLSPQQFYDTNTFSPPPPAEEEVVHSPVTRIDGNTALDEAIESRDDVSAITAVIETYTSDAVLQGRAFAALKHSLKSILKKKTHEEEMRLVDDDNIISMEQHVLGIQAVLNSMKIFQNNNRIQVGGVLILSLFTKIGDEIVIESVASGGGLKQIFEAMRLFPNEEQVQVEGLGIFANPILTNDEFIKDACDSCKPRVIIAAMRRFALNERIQGLGCVTLTNLCRQNAREIVATGGIDVVVASMARFPNEGSMQSVAALAIGLFSEESVDAMECALTAGAVPLCEKARKRFPNIRGLQRNTSRALKVLMQDEGDQHDGSNVDGDSSSTSCRQQ